MREVWSDVLVVGSGVAGLTFALKVADGASVTVVTKKHRAESNTNYAQGGVAAVMASEDSPRDHIRDTLEAGAGLCHLDAVEGLVREGPLRVRELMDWGVEFSRTGEGRLHLGREGGHSHRRIVHALDRTGRAIEHALLDAVEAHPRVEVLEDHLALDLLPGRGPAGDRWCAGVLVLDRTTGELVAHRAACTLLASGGLGRIYRHTTNPAIATGDGFAMAWRAGARLANLEFVQFHPTALYPAEDRAVLISEAVRGEGAVLLRTDGTPLMTEHARGSLSTRDVVARAIDRELKESGAAHVLLDLSPIPAGVIDERFPNIMAECAERGLDIRREPVPVVPAAHYACGGVATDAHGQTSVPGLFAAGEVAFTGVHGANRLASNSLLEAVVYAHRAALRVRELLEARAGRGVELHGDLPLPPRGAAAEQMGESPHALEAEVRTLLWEDCGIVRTDERLARAERRLAQLSAEVERLRSAAPMGPGLAEVRNVVDTALLVVRCARTRRESRGLHFNTDHPETVEAFRHDTVIEREGGASP